MTEIPPPILDTVKDLDDLKARASGTEGVFRIILAGGAAFSEKDITYEDGTWYIFNWIDGTETELTDEELWTETNIGEALDKHALVEVTY